MLVPVDQEILEGGRGDCYRACVASIIGHPIEGVPNFIEQCNGAGSEHRGKPMTVLAREWLEPHGYSLIYIQSSEQPSGFDKLWVGYSSRCVILSGVSPRKSIGGETKYHAVVGQANGWGYRLVHDPHPSRAGIVGPPFGITWIVRTHRADLAEKCLDYVSELMVPIRDAARSVGYAIAVHGTLRRDIDLVAVPWEVGAVQPVGLFATIDAALRKHLGVDRYVGLQSGDRWNLEGCPGLKPHGRLCWTIYLAGGPYIDLSVIPPNPDAPVQGKAECTPPEQGDLFEEG